jgi:hypothetical protein
VLPPRLKGSPWFGEGTAALPPFMMERIGSSPDRFYRLAAIVARVGGFSQFSSCNPQAASCKPWRLNPVLERS